ncbi:RluA family pseudouridine synthase [Schwartzia succinivorans]|uniref:Pseudouridine synthase n=1 Tax=Schwartzia succinivorans DSM 10502 TaxID=1123243 RepID=A0A1M4UT53_9FIRM|nr:RluA family pseudouridine synthase [Schwartzia succinivorans]MCR5447501.1 RluA family pseudouridine synthase [Schwartzia sp. (in: firmicutes)]SHE59858.1 23S rRNA pseudouridine1911/1915/1917 synthase [Schwartzia succinivorans DSM 10502]
MERFEYTAETTGTRLDVFLSEKQPELSRSHIQKVIESGGALVNGKAEKSRTKLKEGDTVSFTLPDPVSVDVLPEDIPLDILYEDHDVIVVNKARGMVVHPAAGVYNGTLVNALLHHCEDLSGINGAVRPGIVHRLDKDTSGVMIAAKNDAAHVDLAEQIRVKSAHRVYLAVVCGNIAEESGTIHGAIGRSQKDRQKMAVVLHNGKDATTKFKVLERYGDYTLVECRLLTGRTHQIRVHMAFIGHPVLGDPKYGPKKCPFAIEGQALHSKSLTFEHPVSKKEMTFEAPVPEDMQRIIDSLRKRQGIK